MARHSLICTPSRTFNTKIANQTLCGVLVSRPVASSPISLDGSNAILCSPPKRITTRGARHGMETAISGTSHMRTPWNSSWASSVFSCRDVDVSPARLQRMRLFAPKTSNKAVAAIPTSNPHFRPIIATFSIESKSSIAVVGGYLICCSSHASHRPCHAHLPDPMQTRRVASDVAHLRKIQVPWLTASTGRTAALPMELILSGLS